MLKMRNQGQMSLVLLALLAVTFFAPMAQAQPSIEQASIDRAHAFLATTNRGKNVLGYVHFGAQYKGHAYQETRNVVNKPGQFALVYRFNWENDGVTSVAFLCDAKGSVYQVQVLSSNAILQQPYALANASINIVGNVILDAFRNQMTKEDIQQARQFIDNPNARGLLEMSMRLDQAFAK